ncbi:MAG: hypothetical protein HYT27_00755 [Parcubacteria group bacterium]|nr:hypothetical protein [Parcubacteria group bacterium]
MNIAYKDLKQADESVIVSKNVFQAICISLDFLRQHAEPYMLVGDTIEVFKSWTPADQKGHVSFRFSNWVPKAMLDIEFAKTKDGKEEITLYAKRESSDFPVRWDIFAVALNSKNRLFSFEHIGHGGGSS